jgi:hypothetical protein
MTTKRAPAVPKNLMKDIVRNKVKAEAEVKVEVGEISPATKKSCFLYEPSLRS